MVEKVVDKGCPRRLGVSYRGPWLSSLNENVSQMRMIIIPAPLYR